MSTASGEAQFEALGLFEQAIAIDRHYGPALSWAAICRLRLGEDGWAEEPETNRRKAVDLTRQALQVAQNDPGILANAAFVLAYFGEDIGATIGLADRALALNPSFARGWHLSGVLRLWAGQHDLAIEHAETALRLSPRVRVSGPLYVMGAAYFFKRAFDEAAAKLLLAIQDDSGLPIPYRCLAACYALMGHLDDARAAVAQLRAITPEVVPTNLPWRNPEDRELFLSGYGSRRARCHDQYKRLTAILAAAVAGLRLNGLQEDDRPALLLFWRVCLRSNLAVPLRSHERSESAHLRRRRHAGMGRLTIRHRSLCGGSGQALHAPYPPFTIRPHTQMLEGQSATAIVS